MLFSAPLIAVFSLLLVDVSAMPATAETNQPDIHTECNIKSIGGRSILGFDQSPYEYTIIYTNIDHDRCETELGSFNTSCAYGVTSGSASCTPTDNGQHAVFRTDDWTSFQDCVEKETEVTCDGNIHYPLPI